MPQPTLVTPRLILRPFGLSDAPQVTELVSDFAIADMVLHILHPYGARLRSHVKKWDRYEDLECYSVLREEFSGS